MQNLFSTVTKKVIFGYLVIVLFSLLAVGFALYRLNQQTDQTEQLVNVDFRAFELVRDLQQNLLAQENIEKQLLILRDPDLRQLRLNRNQELSRLAHTLSRPPLVELLDPLPLKVANYRNLDNALSEALLWHDWAAAVEISEKSTVPSRVHLLKLLTEVRQEQQQRINSGLAQLSQRSGEAYQLTLLFTLIGICLSAPASLAVILSIHRSVRALKKAIREISSGSFEHQPDLSGDEEFAQLAIDFNRMGRKLRDLEQQQLDANPLTRLPGNLAIDREFEERISDQIPFAHLYIDLDNFKAYSDRYGYNAGSDVLSQVGNMLQRVVDELGTEDDFVGHIGGDDYVVISTPELAESLALKMIAEFDNLAPAFYSVEDRRAGSFVGEDRYGIRRTIPLITISIAVNFSDHYDFPSRLAISQDCARLKEYLKIQDGSNYMLDRRK